MLQITTTEKENKYLWVKGETDENEFKSQKEFVKSMLEKFGNKIKFTVVTEHDIPKKVREEELRLFISSEDRLCYFKPRSSRYGYPLMYHGEVLTISYTEKKKKENAKEDKFIKDLNKVISYLDDSGLWSSLNETFKAYRVIGADLCLEAYSEYWNGFYQKGESLEDVKARINKKKNLLKKVQEKISNSNISEADKELVTKVFKLNEINNETIKDYLAEAKYLQEDEIEMLNSVKEEPTFSSLIKGFGDVEYIKSCKIKTMVFHKSSKYFNRSSITEKIRAELKEAINEKRDYRATGDNGYDVTVNYQAKDNKAWYSEEYRGCGNGHYYLALDHAHALFCEDD